MAKHNGCSINPVLVPYLVGATRAPASAGLMVRYRDPDHQDWGNTAQRTPHTTHTDRTGTRQIIRVCGIRVRGYA